MKTALLLLALASCAHRPPQPAGTDLPLPVAAANDIEAALRPIGLALDQSSAEHAIDAVLVLHDGAPVFEHYYHGYSAQTPHDLRSATKSITAILVSIALDQGALSSPDVPVMYSLRSTWPHVVDKEGLTVRHLLNMQTGLDCDDDDRSTEGQEDRVYRTRDWTGSFLALDVVEPPGQTTRYCTAGVITLGQVLAHSTGRDVADFAQHQLFGPLGVRNLRWARYDRHTKVDTGGHLELTARGLARVGQLMLQEGRWNGQQLVSADQVHTLLTPTTSMRGTPYGHLWWLDEVAVGDRKIAVHSARGNGGQALFVVPELDLVVVTLASWYNRPQAGAVYQLVYSAILPAVARVQAEAGLAP